MIIYPLTTKIMVIYSQFEQNNEIILTKIKTKILIFFFQIFKGIFVLLKIL
jgi:hypothetical protein